MLGFSLKNSEFSLLCGGFNLGFRKMQPLAKASNGAGPSYGNDNPTKSWETNAEKRSVSLLSPLGGSKLNDLMLDWTNQPIQYKGEETVQLDG